MNMRILCTFALLLGAVGADYQIPEPAERFYVLADDWRLDGNRLEVWRGQKGMRFKLDTFWMADRIDGSSICCGREEIVVKEHVAAITAKKKKPVIRLELCAREKGEPLFVADMREAKPSATERKRDAATWKKLYAR